MYRPKDSLNYISSFFILFSCSKGINKLKLCYYLIIKLLEQSNFIRLRNRNVKIIFKDISFWFGLFSGELGSYIEIFVRKVYEHLPEFRVNKGNTLLDIGGNIGFYTIKQSQRVGNSGKIWVFEPNPEVFQRLIQNLKENKINNAIPVSKAVGSVNGKVFFRAPKNATQEGSLCNYVKMPSPVENVIEVDCVTLDDFVQQNGIFKIDLLKVDVEGNEIEVLKGGVQKALPLTEKIVLEFHGNETKEKVIRFAEENNFKMVFEDAKNRVIYFMGINRAFK